VRERESPEAVKCKLASIATGVRGQGRGPQGQRALDAEGGRRRATADRRIRMLLASVTQIRSGPPNPQVFCACFYNHARRLRLEKLSHAGLSTLEAPTDFLNRFWIQVAVSLLKPPLRLNSCLALCFHWLRVRRERNHAPVEKNNNKHLFMIILCGSG
jgi:hypothetical protein